MRALNRNYIYTSTITASDVTGYTFASALVDSRLCRKGRFSGTTGTLNIDLGTAKQCDYVAIISHNLTPDATVSITYSYDNSSWAVLTYIPRNWLETYTRITPEGDTRITSDGDTRIVTFDHPFTTLWDNNLAPFARYWRITFTDPRNADGYVEIGGVYLGSYIQLPAMSPDQTIPRNSTSEQSFNETGQLHAYRKYQYKGVGVNFPAVTDAEKNALDELFVESDITDPLLLIFWEDDTGSQVVEEPLYCVLSKLGEPKHIGNGLWSYSLSFRECK